MSMRAMQICPLVSALSAGSDNLDLSAGVRCCNSRIKLLLLINKPRPSTLSGSGCLDDVGADNGWNGPP